MAVTARQKNLSSHRNGRSPGRRKASRRSRHARDTAAAALSRAQDIFGEHVAGDAQDMRAEVGQLVHDIKNRLDRLNRLTKRGASHAAEGVNDFAQDLAGNALAGMTGRMRKSAQGLGSDAAKIGNGVLGRIVHGMEKRPLLTLAIALGLGVAAGFARRD